MPDWTEDKESGESFSAGFLISFKSDISPLWNRATWCLYFFLPLWADCDNHKFMFLLSPCLFLSACLFLFLFLSTTFSLPLLAFISLKYFDKQRRFSQTSQLKIVYSRLLTRLVLMKNTFYPLKSRILGFETVIW